jgi:nitroreductase
MIPETTESDSVRIFDQIVRDRRSIRGFLSTPVAAEVLERVFETAAFAPSNCNTQPWYSHVVSGEMRDRLSGIFMQTIGQGKHSLDFPYEAKYDGIYRQRQLDVGDAPHVVFIFMPEWCGIREACDVGMYAQTLMLAMRAHGIASCPQTILGYDADSVRRELGIGPDMKLLFGISFGYEDRSLPENRIIPDRATLDEHVKFYP